ncbi:protein rep [Virgibacillus sp. SK37]|uniref:protein rep n=1 Tax=Virgibacillus sp. SK37 TaxID=403957 RepID=UPI0004D0FB1D|nr:protein rep [Virgibacillus sp. SK37]AIF45754.1 hypothetical protein X953_19940 [Virgibacillus sp. SK37]
MNKYIEKKQKNQVLSKFIQKFVSEASWELIEDCNTFMMMVANESMEKKKQHKGNTCKNRFCPICAWKKSRKDALALGVQMEFIKQEHQKDFIFLTLTTPNVAADQLENEIKTYNHAFQKLMQRKEVSKITKGYVRKLEVTYDKERFITKNMYRHRKSYYELRGLNIGDNNPNYNTYNPHFHVLITVNKSYFTQTKEYIKHERWLELWKQVTDNPNITQVDVRKVRENKNKEVSEIVKYTAKDSDYLIDESVFEVFYKALKGKRIIVHSGLFKESMKLFKNGELDKYKEIDTTEYVYALMYSWGNADYVEQEKRLLTVEERKEVNQQLIDEKDVECYGY